MVLISLKHIFNNSFSKAIIFRIPKVKKYEDISVEGVRTRFHHAYGGWWAEFKLWHMAKMASRVPHQGPSLLLSVHAFWTHLIILLNTILPNKLKPVIEITVYISRCGKKKKGFMSLFQIVFVQNIPVETVAII